LIVGTGAELGTSELLVEGVSWTLDEPPPDGARLECKIRYKAQAVPCRVYADARDTLRVRFEEPLRGVTPGQGAVFYDRDHCLGGGVIARQGGERAA
jgi:tRNA-specific 2-thiouridylase